jgi:aminocarboxymuconate-semialdehyde decarboxylase
MTDQAGGAGRVIDVHAHHVSPALIEAVERDGGDYGANVRRTGDGLPYLVFRDGPTVRPFFPELWDLDARVQRLDRLGIDLQVLATWADIAGYHLSPDRAAAWARLQNDTLADAVRRHPARFVALGTLPMQDVERSLSEMRYAVDTLGLRGFEICTNVEGRDLDDEQFRPFWKLACDLDVLIFLHPPVRQVGSERLGRYFLNNLVGNPVETTIAAIRLIFSGVVQDLPIKCLLAHGGGMLPYQIGRFDRGYTVVPGARANLRKPPSEFLGAFYYDTILFDDRALGHLFDVVPAERVMLGTDCPFEMQDENAATRVAHLPDLDENLRQLVLGATAAQLLLTGR